jgi:hypothetical protein
MNVSWIRAAALAAALAFTAAPASADVAAANKAFGRLLAQYGTPRGIRYDAWRASGTDLKSISEVVMIYRGTDPNALEPDERKALYINLYNSRILENVLFLNPKGSIKDLSKGASPFEIFNRKTLNFDGKQLSLNDLEKRLREEFKDPRIHFALNCASKSCPPIRTQPYRAATLDAELDESVRNYLNSPGAVDVSTAGGKPRIVTVKIFDWYADDFKATGGALAFIAKYGPAAAADAIAGGRAKLDFADYDWGLNAAK